MTVIYAYENSTDSNSRVVVVNPTYVPAIGVSVNITGVHGEKPTKIVGKVSGLNFNTTFNKHAVAPEIEVLIVTVSNII